MRVVRWLGLIILVLATTASAAAPLAFDGQPWSLGVTMPLWYVVPGLVVMARRPWHQVGWLLILVGLGLTTTNLPSEPALLGEQWYPWFTWVTGSWGGYFTYTAMVALLVVFPDGLAQRPRRDRITGRILVGTMAILTILSATSGPVASNTSNATYANPLGVHLVPKAASDAGFALVILTVACCVVWLWRRRSQQEGEARRRYTLVLYSFGVLAVCLAFGISASATLGDGAWLPAYIGWFLVPAAFAVAVVRHGLYGVDRMVRRTVGYGLVAVIVGAVYVIPVVSLPRFLGESNHLVVAGSTLAAAAAFASVRRRVQGTVDRRFDRTRYDAELEVSAFADRLTDEVDLATVTESFGGVITRTLAPTSSSIWLRSAR